MALTCRWSVLRRLHDLDLGEALLTGSLPAEVSRACVQGCVCEGALPQVCILLLGIATIPMGCFNKPSYGPCTPWDAAMESLYHVMSGMEPIAMPPTCRHAPQRPPPFILTHRHTLHSTPLLHSYASSTHGNPQWFTLSALEQLDLGGDTQEGGRFNAASQQFSWEDGAFPRLQGTVPQRCAGLQAPGGLCGL